jgi:ferritin-like protein
MTSKVLKNESIEKFLKNARIEEEYTEIVIVIRNVLSKWIGTHPTSFISLENTKDLRCQDWDSTEFMWQVLDELGLDLFDTEVDFPDLFPCKLPFLNNKKTYETVGEWVRAVIYEWYLSSRFERV